MATVKEIAQDIQVLIAKGYGDLPVYASDDGGNYGELSIGSSKSAMSDSIMEHSSGMILDDLAIGDEFIHASLD